MAKVIGFDISLIDGRKVPRDVLERLLARFWPRFKEVVLVETLEKPCQIWQGATHADGYGSVEVLKDKVRYGFYTHRLAYILKIGPIPKGKTVDHLCRQRMCGEPTHLEPVSRGENVRRGIASSPEVRARAGKSISVSQTGRVVSEETKARLRAAWTPEKRAAMSALKRSK